MVLLHMSMTCILSLRQLFVLVQLWMQIFQHIITAMLFFQIIMIALFGIKKAPGPAVLTGPLPFITVAFLLYNLKLFNRPQVLISNRTAADIDKRQSQVSVQHRMAVLNIAVLLACCCLVSKLPSPASCGVNGWQAGL